MYWDIHSASGDGGGGSSGDGGPGLGKFRNVYVRVELTNGLSADALVDSVRGVVHVKIKNYTGPVRFTMFARDKLAEYFDEAIGKFVPFPVDEKNPVVMNAVVPKFDKNVGITTLTESAWQYLAKIGPNAWKDPDAVAKANLIVRDEFNKYLAEEFQVADITRLPYLLSDTTSAGSIPSTENGKYGIVLSGLGVAAGLFQPSDPYPALALLDQMSRDFCDGNLDEACDRELVYSDPAKAAYRITQLKDYLATGIDRVVASCSTEELTPRIRQIRADASRRPYAYQSYADNTPLWLLRNDGQVFFWPHRNLAASAYSTPPLRQLFAQGPLLGTSFPVNNGQGSANRAYTAEYSIDSSGIAVAQTPGEIPNYAGVDLLKALDYRNNPASFAGLGQIVRKQDQITLAQQETQTQFDNGALLPFDLRETVVDVAVAGSDFGRAFYAVTLSGAAYAWGSNEYFMLANGELKSSGAPLRIQDLAAKSIIGHMTGAFALDSSGGVWAWGGRHPGVSFGKDATGNEIPATPRPTPLGEFKPFGQIVEMACAEYDKCVARNAAGQMIVWGNFYEVPVDLSRLESKPREVVPTLVRTPEGTRVISVTASGLNVYALLNDGQIVVLRTMPGVPEYLSTSKHVPRSTSGLCK